MLPAPRLAAALQRLPSAAPCAPHGAAQCGDARCRVQHSTAWVWPPPAHDCRLLAVMLSLVSAVPTLKAQPDAAPTLCGAARTLHRPTTPIRRANPRNPRGLGADDSAQYCLVLQATLCPCSACASTQFATNKRASLQIVWTPTWIAWLIDSTLYRNSRRA